MSQTIKKIEKELGAEILKRTNYGVDLTDEGRVFAKHARQITEHMVFLNREIEQLANVETGQLFISISYGMFSFYKAKCILDFKALYPDITLEYGNTPIKRLWNPFGTANQISPDLFACGQRTVSNHPAQPQ